MADLRRPARSKWAQKWTIRHDAYHRTRRSQIRLARLHRPVGGAGSASSRPVSSATFHAHLRRRLPLLRRPLGGGRSAACGPGVPAFRGVTVGTIVFTFKSTRTNCAWRPARSVKRSRARPRVIVEVERCRASGDSFAAAGAASAMWPMPARPTCAQGRRPTGAELVYRRAPSCRHHGPLRNDAAVVARRPASPPSPWNSCRGSRAPSRWTCCPARPIAGCAVIDAAAEYDRALP